MDAFQHNVAKKQVEIEAMNASQAEYMACQQALLRSAIPNDGQLNLTTTGAAITVIALPSDHSTTFEKFAREIGRELLERRLHGDGEPAVSLSNYWYDVTYTFRTKRPNGTLGSVTMTVTLPENGIRDLQVIREEYASTSMRYRVEPRGATLPPSMPPTTVHEAPPPAAFAIPF
jgi:hypothetical protein